MRKIVFIGLMLLGLLGCQRKEKYTDIELMPFIYENYLQDAKQLYMREIYADTLHDNYHNPVLDTNEIIRILKIFQAVYNCPEPEAELVFNHSIHAFKLFSLNTIRITVDTCLEESANLLEGRIPTGIDELDNLLSLYHFDSIHSFYPNLPVVSLHSREDYHLLPITKQLAKISPVLSADIDMYMGDGNNILLNRGDDESIIIFSIGFGDCPAGCLHRKNWQFKIKNNKAEFMKYFQN